ncbi:Conjugal transfer protein TraD [compost metagenome]
MQDEWLKARISYLNGLKTPNDQQRLLLLLAGKTERTADDNRKLGALVKAEKAAERAQKARASAARIVNAEKEIARKTRDRELYQSAGLLILAGLVDTTTGSPSSDRGELLGALLELAKVPANDPRRGEWKRAGDIIITERSRK